MTAIEKIYTFFTEFGISLDKARSKLKEIPLASDAWNLQGCFHHLYFAMASLVISDVKNVLELGTGLGETTAILSELFPTATIYTLDLPETDPNYLSTWRMLEKKKDALERFKQNIKRKNIIFIPKNSFFLSSLELPEKFEIIWVDGGHKFPVVAWDIMFAYNHLKESGFMFMHDFTSSGHSHVKNTLEYVTRRIKETVWLLPSNAKNENAKTACIRKIGW